MNIKAKLASIQKVFLDTAPIIYYVEQNTTYFSRANPIFEAIDQGLLSAVTSPITLAECLIFPIRLNQLPFIETFRSLIIHAENTQFVEINEIIGHQAAELRVQYNLTLTDALQIATAQHVDCDAFLTNDIQLKRVQSIEVLCLQDFEYE
ncbi:VapC toxin family PIN domain ribonuclease [bacterium (Candidatus Blackallbacteria) CG17_big_fil_post_rev_8_21_14_2_50_48_46]|uniref:VapC toxin family PIN domain ribonuclease n=1 Tax=bacterium (Candidatus Blackallbacteria) CG17_big_fil_post_rev_8_21_14_2_50_48_46 TaxID=2014261 RepID=A0A2M7G6H9_9BACT|nr:MAG: VapC toxin family PIN domain ribonuclease [bacterium (Candidatus Blackallbacteria) CG18_big_fil_WC_8_21_14_2_50_49_26]PIW17650.1 MAG: VapC toxin family PIN domain ribonuclease [bacterium (Candidatus Blackallbacteria) CG17_big_fil_post_rev_8_21_14_2_50_48_46]PIW49298.1 MAG: VapC toxin family PIN domain ribonuclease [bacterium (Candidatus Blackallbacteria) CG13_big_fil_rev_8_21_14_2_50_49_14]